MDFSAPARRGISFREIEALLAACPARRKALFLDSCHAGHVDRELPETTIKTSDGTVRYIRHSPVRGLDVERPSGIRLRVDDYFRDLGTCNGATVIAACGGTEYATEGGTVRNGAFTFSILAGLAAAAAFYLALGRGLRSLPTYLLLGAAVAPLFQLVSADLPILPLPLVVGEVQTLIVVVGTWGLLSIARALRL